MGTSSSWIPSRCRSRRAVAAWLLALGLLLAQAVGGPALEAIFPSADVLPANQLKFYLHFFEPMREGVFLDYCRLLDEHGKEVAEPFRETELWSDDHRRLTLWLHPGRQKTGVNLNIEFGPVLEPERSYTLLISGAWPTASGTTLGADMRKRFRTTARATAQLDPGSLASCCTQSSRAALLTALKPAVAKGWQIIAPPAGTREPLEIRFPSPLDHALLLRCLRVVQGAEAAVAGVCETADQERAWRFTPAQPWPEAPCRIFVETILEDLAGNSLARPFEVDLQGPAAKVMPREIALSFTPAPRGKN